VENLAFLGYLALKLCCIWPEDNKAS